MCVCVSINGHEPSATVRHTDVLNTHLQPFVFVGDPLMDEYAAN